MSGASKWVHVKRPVLIFAWAVFLQHSHLELLNLDFVGVAITKFGPLPF